MYIPKSVLHTAEPPIKDTPSKGHLSIKDKTTCPNMSFIRRFHCIIVKSECTYTYFQLMYTTYIAMGSSLSMCLYTSEYAKRWTKPVKNIQRGGQRVLKHTVPRQEHFIHGLVSVLPLNTANTPSTLPITNSFSCRECKNMHNIVC